MRTSEPAVRRRIRVTGVVQGVGFRPFVYKLALTHELAGWVLNDPEGVLTEVAGPAEAVERFTAELTTLAPPQARVTGVRVAEAAELTYGAAELAGFTIRESVHDGPKVTVVPADSHVCADCLGELRDPADRRYRYPFINCTNCGPRYSIVRELPYDRATTTMAAFTMCAPCEREYRDPLDRRYHAQPNACADCGPRLLLAAPDGGRSEGEAALAAAAAALREGLIVAVKSVGGFHLAVDAHDEQAVARLRSRKRRDSKPFAVLARDLAAAERFVHVRSAEAALLNSPARPIVLLRKRAGALPEAIAPRNPNLGVMLPSAPQHHLLVDHEGLDALVMTSGNISGYPIVHRNEEALAQLFAVADLILFNDRDIETRVDDSLVRYSEHPELADPLVSFLRRARGYAPYPVELGFELAPLVAYGAELKTTVALAAGSRVYVSQHIGDLKNDETFASHRETVQHLAALHDLAPRHAAVDLHPQFRATRFALKEQGGAFGQVLRVQHHHAHMASCMAENRLTGETIGVVFDGAGYGEDGTTWGGEFLLGDYREVRRAAHLRPVPLLGGDRAVHEPIRTGLALALDALGGTAEAVAAFPVLERLGEQQLHVFATMARRGVNAPLASSMGRLFDGVAALLAVTTHAEYEAQGPIELEGLLERDLAMAPAAERYRFGAVPGEGSTPAGAAAPAEAATEIDPRPVVRALAADLAAGVEPAVIARRFHSAVVDLVVERCQAVRAERGAGAGSQVVLSGGVFLNEFLLVNCLVELRRAGFDAYCQQQVPTNDGGIALGQIAVADARLKQADLLAQAERLTQTDLLAQADRLKQADR
ncbi:carbamoyltransferase HypF [Kitasatospora sp. NBC_01287]|uniref:carbamoyltransferase HypF n=1 Tax=Kitasatospora sp. NBC_01287 TaxID=2903573 RepID=UPI00225885EE|nr:carbamoyltransferase HypF [Kitasatospora sp. NBC_01287]MCX4744053.1 carbamoyltransferase HypF [Kitasatospora sp. NBC_01287]